MSVSETKEISVTSYQSSSGATSEAGGSRGLFSLGLLVFTLVTLYSGAASGGRLLLLEGVGNDVGGET